MAFLPQFVTPANGAIPLQILLLGTLYVLLAVLTDGAYALLASHCRAWLGRRRTIECRVQRGSGVVYIGLGIGAALADRR